MHTFAYVLPLSALGLLAVSSPAGAQQAAVTGDADVAPAAAPVDPAPAPAQVQAEAQVGLEAEPVEVAQVQETDFAVDTDSAMPAEGTAPIADPTPAEPAAEDEGVPAWFRVDSDSLGLQVWFGATHDLGGINLATDIYVTSGVFGEFDVGVEVPIGEQVLLIPMVGIGFDWSQQQPTTLIVPQLFAYLDFSPVYIEYWGQFFLSSPLASDDELVAPDVTAKDAAPDTFYNRLFLLFNVSETVALGVQTEPTFALNDAAKVNDGALTSLPVGLRANVGYGENNTLGLFLGYETVEEARPTYTDVDGESQSRAGIVGRFTFLKTW